LFFQNIVNGIFIEFLLQITLEAMKSDIDEV